MASNDMTTKRVSPHTLLHDAGITSRPYKLTPDEKEKLAALQIAFDIVEAAYITEATHGACWMFICVADERKFTFFMSDPMDTSKGREPLIEIDAEYHAIRTATLNGQFVGPYRLDYIQRKDKPAFYSLIPAEPFPVESMSVQELLPF